MQFPGVSADSALGKATRANASCVGCEWSLAPSCTASVPGETALCGNAVQACTAPAVAYWVYFRRPPAPWQFVSTVCLGPGQRPRSVADVGEAVRTEVLTLLPDAAPSFQPAAGGIVNLPTLFAAGEPASLTTDAFDVLGFTVVVKARARWEWTFDDGVVQLFDKPGGAYPIDDVAYTYASKGERSVQVTSYWAATFTVDGDGPFQVPGGEIAKTAAPVTVPVREARAELVGG